MAGMRTIDVKGNLGKLLKLVILVPYAMTASRVMLLKLLK